MSTPQEHATAAGAIGTGLLTFFHILPEVLGCILSVCGIIWYVIQIRYAYMERKEHRTTQEQRAGRDVP
jgi:hypothetical protein